MSSALQPILSGGVWKHTAAASHFQGVNPRTTKPLPDLYPVSSWADLDAMLTASWQAFEQMRLITPEQRAAFLERYAAEIDVYKGELAAMAEQETALPQDPRLLKVEIPRTIDQLRQAAQATQERSWTMATIDVPAKLRSMYIPLGPVVVFGPNNFPFAYNGVCGGDFAAAIAAGCPVIAKGHPAHPGTTRLLAELAFLASKATHMPAALLQMIYKVSHEDGGRLAADPRVGAIAFTGSRHGGITLKESADKVGKPIYLEMGSLNPVVILPGALEERLDEVFTQVVASCLTGMGQFCTNPGILLLLDGAKTGQFLKRMQEHYTTTAVGTLLTETVRNNLAGSVQALIQAGAQVLAGGKPGGGEGFSHQHTLLTVPGDKFLKRPHELQQEAFGNATLAIIAANLNELSAVLETFEGQLVGSIYSHRGGADDKAYDLLAPLLRQRVGRFQNDKMPTGVLVSSAQNHGGPFPATGHPHFTAVGFPASIRRFAMLAAYDNVRQHRLPPELQDQNPTGSMWRLINQTWTQENVKS
jgi:2,5-dioxopentanoate dehydrogenase